MNFVRTTLLSAALLMAAGAAVADTIVISPENETVIREYVTKNPGTVVEVPSDYDLSVGGVIPDNVTLVPVDVPDVKYEYVVIGGRTAIVEPGTRRVIQIYD